MTMLQQEQLQRDWMPTELSDDHFDPLLSCLATLTKLHGRPIPAENLSAGLPLENNLLTPSLFIKAAKKVGLSARIVKRPLNKISNLLLPAVLLLKDNNACIALEIDKENDIAQVILPETGDGEDKLTHSTLSSRYIGYVIFVKPEHDYEEATTDVAEPDDKSWFWSNIGDSWRIYRDVLLASFFINSFALASPIFIMNVYDRVVPNNAFETLWMLGLGVAIIFLFDLLFRGLRGYFIDVAGKKSDIIISSKIYEKVLGLRMDNRPSSIGAFANNLGEFESIRNFITSATISTLIDLPFVALFLIVIAYIGGPLVYVPLAGIPIILIYGLIVQKPLKTSVEHVMRTSAQKNANLIETLMGAETIKTSRAEGQMQKKWEQSIGNIAHWGIRSRFLSASTTNVAIFVQQMATIAVVTYGVYLASTNELSLGGLIAAVILTSRAMAPMAHVANITSHYHEARSALKTLNIIMSLPVEREAARNYAHKDSVSGEIEFDKVSFAYPGQSGLNALNDVSFKINPGERVGIIGKTGSGKSTIQKLILDLYKPGTGLIKLDGIDMQQIDPVSLRKHIGYVPQDITLFNDNLRENIILGAPYIDDEQILKVADIAGVTEYTNNHPLGLDMPLGERGAALSGGQRQSVVIARALLREPSILVLDEPSNSMDNTTEAKFLTRLEKHLENQTLILVTHRASMLKLVNRLLVIEKGHIIADGPKELVIGAMKEGTLGLKH